MSQKKRELEQWEKDECAALKAAISTWNRNRPKNERMTQEQAGEALGMNQGSFSNYLNGRTALNIDFALKIKVLFGIPVENFSPRLASAIREKYELIDDIQRESTHRTHEAIADAGGAGLASLWALNHFFERCKEDPPSMRRDVIKHARTRIAHQSSSRETKSERLLSLFYSIAAAEIDGKLSEQELGILEFLVTALWAKYEDERKPESLTGSDRKPVP